MIPQIPRSEISVQPEVLFTIGDFPFTNSMSAQILVTLLILIISLTFYFGSKISPDKPNRFRAAIELIVEGLESFFGQIAGDMTLMREILPIVGSLALYIVMCNLIGTIFPFLDSFKYEGISIFRLPTSDFNVTVSLALLMVVLSHIYTIQRLSLFTYLGKFFKFKELFVSFKGGVGSGLMGVLTFVLGLFDIISEISKVISLSLRLFGNMFAGGLITAVLMSLLAIFLPIPIALMGLLTAVLQGVIFGALVTSYISLSVKE